MTKRTRWLLLVIIILVCYAIINGALLLGYGFSKQISASMPEGWYVTYPIRFPLKRYQIVLFTPPPWALHYMDRHHWFRANMLMMKQVYGLPGDHVCIRHHAVWINGKRVATIVQNYAPGKSLPKLHYCQRLPKDHYFMMSTHIVRSFDSRYIGPIPASALQKSARFLMK